eukprot:753820-Hanusia_phi.AAC.1
MQAAMRSAASITHPSEAKPLQIELHSFSMDNRYNNPAACPPLCSPSIPTPLPLQDAQRTVREGYSMKVVVGWSRTRVGTSWSFTSGYKGSWGVEESTIRGRGRGGIESGEGGIAPTGRSGER